MRDTRAYPSSLRIAPCVCREAHSMQRSDAPAPRVTPPLAGRPPLRWSAASLLPPPPPEQPARVAQRHRSGDSSKAADFVEMGHKLSWVTFGDTSAHPRFATSQCGATNDET